MQRLEAQSLNRKQVEMQLQVFNVSLIIGVETTRELSKFAASKIRLFKKD